MIQSQQKPPSSRQLSLPVRLHHAPPADGAVMDWQFTETPPLDEVGSTPARLALSHKLTRREPLSSKPDPQGRPRVWAESRQALCETLPYFKRPQGGCYSNDGHVYGFLFDGFGHCREYMDENLILCRAGGSMEPDSGGEMVQRKDQSMTEAQVAGVINDMEHHNPVAVICGSKNIAAPTKMPHLYNVLGWYKPVLVWAEKTKGKGDKTWITVRYRLERLNQHLEPAWHAPRGRTVQYSDEERMVAGALFTKDCDICGKTFPRIYLQGWMCLNPSCHLFWQLPSCYDAPCDGEGLDYDPAFLMHRSHLWREPGDSRELVPGDLRPTMPNHGGNIGDNLLYINTRGICCPKCGRCNSRRSFSGWKCESLACDWSFFPSHQPVLPTMLHTPWDAAPTLVRNRVADAVNVISQWRHHYKVSVYTFAGITGSFVHLAASQQILNEDRGPNDMFRELQTADLGLERRVFVSSKCASESSDGSNAGAQPTKDTFAVESVEESAVGDAVENAAMEEVAQWDPSLEHGQPATGDLMKAFSMNFGMPYKFVASGASRSFAAAPWPVVECRRRLNWAQKEFLPNREDYKDFNEQLVFAYLEGQKIEYHDDGENGLGPRIATLSLGWRAKMHLRLKAKHHVGCSPQGIFTEERPVPGGLDGEDMYRRRLEKWEELQKIKHLPAEYKKRRKEIPQQLGIYEKKTKKAADLVTVTLNHGDIVIMDGYDLQKYLEHKVVPEGHLRFALTCRTVLAHHLKPHELPSYRVEEDPITYDGPNNVSGF